MSVKLTSSNALLQNMKGSVMHSLNSAEARAALAGVTHIYTDLDGTLLAPGGRLLTNHLGKPSTKLAEALVLLKHADIEVIIVTGRDVASSTEIMRLTNLNQFIAEMGCIVQTGYGASAQKSYRLGQWETKADFQNAQRGKGLTPYEMIVQSGILDVLLRRFERKLEMHCLPGSSREVTCLMRGNIDSGPGGEADSLLAQLDLPLQLMDNGVIRPNNHTLVNVDEVHVYHLMPRGTGKDQAVAADIAAKGLAPRQTLAIGDAIGDIAMGTATGSFVLVNNLSEGNLQDYATGVLPNPEASFATSLPNASGWTEFAHALLASIDRKTFNSEVVQ